MEDVLADSSARLVTFTGPAGVGKSWAAHELARRLAHREELQVVTVPMGNARGFDDLLRRVASAAELPPSWAVLGERVMAALAVERHLVILDGCERLRGDPHPAELLLRLVPSLRVLATSLRPLRLEQEHVVGLDPFVVPPTSAGQEELRESAPVRLFLDKAAEAHRGFDPETCDLVAVAELCRRVHGLPLGIEIVAAHAATQTPAAMLEYLDSGHEIALQRTRGTRNPRHLSIRSALAWSCSMLEPRAARLLRRMSVFAGPATMDMLLTVADAVPHKERAARPSYAQLLDLVSTLVDHRLVDPDLGPGEPAFALVGLLRDFAQEQLVADGEEAWAQEARTRAVLEFALLREDDMESHHDGVTQRELARSEEDLRWTLRRLMGRADVADGLRLGCALSPFVLRRGYDGFVEPALTSLLRASGTAELDAVLLARAALWRARLSAQFEGPIVGEDVSVALHDALRTARRGTDARTTLLGLSFVLETVPVTGDFAGASAAAGEGLALAEAVEDDVWAARFCAWAGLMACHAGRGREALALARRGIGHAERCRDATAQTLLAMLLSGVPADQARPLAERLPSLDELLAMARAFQDSRYEAFVLRMAATLALRDADLRTAAARCADCLRLTRRHAGWEELPFALMLLTLVAVRRSNYVEAALFHGMARSRLGARRPGPPALWYDEYRPAVETARRVLGELAFETLAERGEADMQVNALAVPLTYAESVAGLHRKRTGHDGAPETTQPSQRLTPREREVLVELTTGETNKQISARLGMTPKTVMHHSMAIYRKLGVRGRAEATAWAFRHGVTD